MLPPSTGGGGGDYNRSGCDTLPSYLSTLGGGGACWGGCGGGGGFPRWGGLRATHYYHTHTSEGGCVSGAGLATC